MSDTRKHPPKPDRFTKRHRTSAHQARTKRVLATLRETNLEGLLPPHILRGLRHRAGEDGQDDATGPRTGVP